MKNPDRLTVQCVESPSVVSIVVNGRRIQAVCGETVQSALSAAGFKTFRKSKRGDARGFFCGMGVCYECLVTIDGKARQRSCMTQVREGMEITTDER